jgi:hypothetical protein
MPSFQRQRYYLQLREDYLRRADSVWTGCKKLTTIGNCPCKLSLYIFSARRKAYDVQKVSSLNAELQTESFFLASFFSGLFFSLIVTDGTGKKECSQPEVKLLTVNV